MYTGPVVVHTIYMLRYIQVCTIHGSFVKAKYTSAHAISTRDLTRNDQHCINVEKCRQRFVKLMLYAAYIQLYNIIAYIESAIMVELK